VSSGQREASPAGRAEPGAAGDPARRRAGRTHRGNLPAELSSFVGRGRALAAVRRLMPASRLVTLTGPGGVGKTRLALRAAATARCAFPDGVWFVDLTVVRTAEPAVLAHLVASTLGMRERSARSPVAELAGYLEPRCALLVLDNCEHMIPAVAWLLEPLLRTCPRLRVLATSREPVGIRGEQIFVVPPMPVPDPRRAETPDDCESMALFAARAATILPDFRLTAANRPAVAEICRRLDGLPLAIELAVPRLRVQSPARLRDTLTDRLAALSRPRATPDRQRTLRACIDWSFHLCTAAERRLWARLTVFAGGCELDDIEGVCADDRLPAGDLLELTAALVDKSIIVPQQSGPVVGYRMLDTIRDYGRDKLAEAGEDAELRRRHRDWYLTVVEQAGEDWLGERQGHWLARLGRNHANLRAAMEFCLAEPGEAGQALRLAVTLPSHHWHANGMFGEGRQWLDSALAASTDTSVLRVRGLLRNSHLAIWQGDTDAVRNLLAVAEPLARQIGDPAEQAHAAYVRGLAANLRKDPVAARHDLEEGLGLLARAARPGLDLRMQLLLSLQIATGMLGDQRRSAACHRELLGITEPRGEAVYRSVSLYARGLTAWRLGDVEEAAASETESLRIRRAKGADDRLGVALSLEVLAWATAHRRQHERAATLLGAADALRTDLAVPIGSIGHLADHHEACVRRTREALGDRSFTKAYDRGLYLDYDEVFGYALGQSPEPARPAGSAPERLTRREQEVAGLVAEGLTNQEIADRLVISRRTAESHVEHILAKLGVTSRVQVATRITRSTGPP
jgi:predicted ATPase/DNA-binding CsgD family transcriptional regulator